MRQRLFELLRCAKCLGKLEAIPFLESSGKDQIIEGVLICGCGLSYPIVNMIPRMLQNAYELYPSFLQRYGSRLECCAEAKPTGRPKERFDRLVAKTQESFGYQWTTFSEMACDFRENFWNYLYPATSDYFQGQLGLDAGCGFGRHIYHAASCGAEMIGMDLSRAIDTAYQNTKQFPNVHLVQADIYALPFAEGTFDFAYSIGVLHHLPDPGRGLKALASLVKPSGALFLWVYSRRRRITNFFLELSRALTTRLPYPLVNGLSFLGALVDQYAFILPYQMMRRIPGVGSVLERVTPPRIRIYSRYPFQVLHADWFDRLAAPIRFYYYEPEVGELMRSAGLSDIRVTPTGLYGWRACGIKQ